MFLKFDHRFHNPITIAGYEIKSFFGFAEGKAVSNHIAYVYYSFLHHLQRSFNTVYLSPYEMDGQFPAAGFLGID